MKGIQEFAWIVFSVYFVAVLGDLGSVLQITIPVFDADVITGNETIAAVQATRNILQRDITVSDNNIAETLNEIGGFVDNIILKYKHNLPVATDVLFQVTNELVLLSETILSAIQNLTCLADSSAECVYDIEKSKNMINATEERILKFLELMISDHSQQTEVEVRNGTMVLAAIRNTGANISEIVTRYSSTLDVPYFRKETTEYKETELFLYVITYTENKYTYVDNRRMINTGTTRIIIRDKDGEFIDLYREEDQLQMIVDAASVLHDPGFWTDINVTSNEEFDLNATFYNNNDGALMNIDVKTIMPCNVTGYDANSVGMDLKLELHLVAGSIMTIHQKPSNLNITFSSQTLTIVFLPPEIGDMISLDLFFKCEVCYDGQMSFLIVLSRDVTGDDLYVARQFVGGMIDVLDLDYSFHVFGTFMQTVFSFNDLVNNSADANLFYQSAGISLADVKEAELDLAINNMSLYLIPKADWSKRQFLVLITDGNVRENPKNDDILTAVDRLRQESVIIIGVNYGDYSKSGFSISDIVNHPPNWHTITLKRDRSFLISQTALKTKMDTICYGTFRTRDYNKMRFGRVSALLLNETTNSWERSENIKMRAISMDSGSVTFQSNFLGTFGSNVFIIPPEVINFNELFVDFTGKLADTPYVLAVNITCIVLLILLVIILRYFDKQDNVAWDYLPLKDNIPGDKYSYFLSFYTGFWSNQRLSSTPYIILRGSRGATSIRVLQDAERGMFQRWTLRNFLLTTNKNLGTLCEIEIWHDGKGSSTGWFLEKILVFDRFNDEKNIFLCGDWLSPDRGDCKTRRRLYTARSKLTEGSVLFGNNTRFNLFDDFLWLSLVSRPSSSRFTRVQRCVSIFAMLFMSMLANAMWYRTSQGEQTYGIHLGPFHLNYKQIYVGLMSSVVTIIPGFLMAWIFRNRRHKTDHSTAKLLNEGFLPWWCVFIAYTIAVICILTGAVFTFFYSLQWGRETTVDWLMSFFMGTMQGVLFLEPIKVVLLTLIIAFLCKKYAQRDLGEMATVHEKASSTDNTLHENDHVVDYEQTKIIANQISMDACSTDNRKRKKFHKRALLDRKLLSVFRALLIKISYIVILAVICAHNSVWTSYLQNRALENLLSPELKINATDDIWSWLRGRFSDRVFPKLFYNGNFRLIDDRQYLSDDVSFRIGVIRLRQVRVKGKCDVPTSLRALISVCPPSYSGETMDTTSYCKGWSATNERRCKGSEWTYSTHDETKALPVVGLHKVYNGGGYVKLLDPNTTEVRNELFSLQANKWIDTNTRLLVVEFILFNPDSKLFSLPFIIIEKPETGGYFTNVKIKTTRLYPYIDVFDFFVLGLQLIFLVITFCRFLHLVVTSWKLGKHCCTNFAQWMYFVSVVTSLASIVFYIVRIDRTIYTVEEIFSSTGTFVSNDIVDLMDTGYKLCIGLELFIAVIDLLTPLNFNHSLYLMRTSISFCGKDLFYLGIASMIPMTAFAILCYCYIGPHEAEFKDIGSSYITLFRTLLAMVKVRDTFDADDILSGLIFSLFLLLMTTIMVNLCICILNAALSQVKEKCLVSTEFEMFDKDLQKHFWRKINKTLNILQRKPENKKELDAETTRMLNLAITLDNQVFKVYQHLEHAYTDEAEDFEIYTNLHNKMTNTQKYEESEITPDTQKYQGHGGTPDKLEYQGHGAKPETDKSQGHGATQDKLEYQGHGAKPETDESQGHGATPRTEEHQGHEATFNTQENEGHGATSDTERYQGHEATHHTEENKGHEATSDTKGYQGHEATHENQGHGAKPDTQECQGHRATSDTEGYQGHEATNDTQECQEYRAKPETEGYQEHGTTSDTQKNQEHGAIPNTQECQGHGATSDTEEHQGHGATPHTEGYQGHEAISDTEEHQGHGATPHTEKHQGHGATSDTQESQGHGATLKYPGKSGNHT